MRQFTVLENGTVRFKPLDKTQIHRVKRFNDTYHNEAVGAKVGVIGKSWADRLMLGFTYSHFYKEIQNGVYQEIVFGEKHRKGHSLVPSLEYSKHGLFTKGLDVALSANYNHNITHNVDTAARGYNWFGESYPKSSRGEQSFQNGESKNTNFNLTARAQYRLGEAHTFTLHHTMSNFKRTNRNYEGVSSRVTDYTIPKITRKNITGLSYRIMPCEIFNASAFAKYYNQYNRGPVSQNEDGIGSYVDMSKTVSSWGYGTAATVFPFKGLQIKTSYEKAYRLPTNDELFGDEDLEAGRADLNPEKSDNLNFNISYGTNIGQHGLYAEVGLIYRDTRDYIKRGLGTTGGTSYGYYENHGHVKTKGYSLTLRYNYSKWITVGGTYNDISTRHYEQNLAGDTEQKVLYYKSRLPNIPYRFANAFATFNWHDLFAKGNLLTVAYTMTWMHEFPLYWENIGSAETKNYVPEQTAHNIALTYSMKNGRYNLSLECNNIANANLYDNFSLQKAGRSIYAKVRVNLGN